MPPLAVILVAAGMAVCPAHALQQDPQPAPPPPPAENPAQFFSGTVAEFKEDKLTVQRSVLGKNQESRTFLVTAETRFEGKPRVNSRVTVRFATSDSGEVAVHVIVRAAKK